LSKNFRRKLAGLSTDMFVVLSTMGGVQYGYTYFPYHTGKVRWNL
jgi:hypothetical protein